MTTATISSPIEWQGTRILKLERPAAPVAPRPVATTPLSRGERLRRGYAMIKDAAMRSAFRKKFWRELSS